MLNDNEIGNSAFRSLGRLTVISCDAYPYSDRLSVRLAAYDRERDVKGRTSSFSSYVFLMTGASWEI